MQTRSGLLEYNFFVPVLIRRVKNETACNNSYLPPLVALVVITATKEEVRRSGIKSEKSVQGGR